MSAPSAAIPYPPVFHDWRPDSDERVSTRLGPAAILVEMTAGPAPGGGLLWRSVELTEDDACLLAASLLDRAGRKGLARRVLRKLARPES